MEQTTHKSSRDYFDLLKRILLLISILVVIYLITSFFGAESSRILIDNLIPEFIGSIIAFIFGAILWDWFAKEAQKDEQKSNNQLIFNKLEKDFKEQTDHLNIHISQISELSLHGIMGYTKIRDDGLLKKKYEKANKTINILYTWLDPVTSLPDEVFEAAARGIEVKIVLINPHCEYSRIRTKSLEFDENRPKILFESVLSVIRQHPKSHQNVQLFLTEEFIPFALYAIDNWALIGFYWAGKGSNAGPHIQIMEKEKGFSYFVNDTFNKILSKSLKYEYDKKQN